MVMLCEWGPLAYGSRSVVETLLEQYYRSRGENMTLIDDGGKRDDDKWRRKNMFALNSSWRWPETLVQDELTRARPDNLMHKGDHENVPAILAGATVQQCYSNPRCQVTVHAHLSRTNPPIINKPTSQMMSYFVLVSGDHFYAMLQND